MSGGSFGASTIGLADKESKFNVPRFFGLAPSSNHHHPSLPSLVSFDSQFFHPSRQVLSPSLPLKPHAETRTL